MNLIKQFIRRKRKPKGPQKAYAIAHWELFYENSQSKRAKQLDYALIPHGCEMRGVYERMMDEPDRHILLSTWHLLLIEASRCPQRGLFIDLSGPISLETLAKRFGLKVSELEPCMEFFIEHLHIIKEVECPQALILSGRSTRRARKTRHGRKVVDLEHVESDTLVHFDYEYTVVDHAGEATIHRDLPAYMPSTEEDEATAENPEESAEPTPGPESPENGVDHTQDLSEEAYTEETEEEPPYAPENEAQNVVDHTMQDTQEDEDHEDTEYSESEDEETQEEDSTPPEPLTVNEQVKMNEAKKLYFDYREFENYCKKHGSITGSNGKVHRFDDKAKRILETSYNTWQAFKNKERKYVSYQLAQERIRDTELREKVYPHLARK